MVAESLVNMTEKLFYIFVPVLFSWLLLKKHGQRFKFRFGRVEGHPNLRPYTKTWVVALVIILITLFSTNIFQLLMGKNLHDWLNSFGNNVTVIFIMMAGFVFLWTYNYILEKKWDKISWGTIGVIGICFVILFL